MPEPNRPKDKPPKGKPPTPPPRSVFARGILMWFILLFIMIVLFRAISVRRAGPEEIPYSKFYEEVEKGNVASITIVEREIKGTFKNPVQSGNTAYKDFKTIMPFEDPSAVENFIKKGVNIEAKQASNLWSMIWPYLPFLVLIIMWIFILRQMQQGPQKALTFGKIRTRAPSKNTPPVTFNDVAGVEEAKEELYEVVEFLKAPERFQKLGGRIPKGVLLLGPPGTGKTLLAKAVAGEAGVPFFSISGSDFVELFVGVGASRVRDLFEKGKRNAPCIIFIDELDAVGRHRGAGIGGGHDEREQTLNALLVEMDGFEPNEGIIVLAATNRPDILDPALLRPGRFDRRIIVDRPDVRGREAIFKVHTRNIPLAKDVNLSILARGTPGFSGADIANMVNEATLLAARRKKKSVGMSELEEAKDKILMGRERRSLIISDEEKKNIAYHESGHALVSKMIPEADPIHKVSIIPRGLAMGITQQLPIDEKKIHSREYCLAAIAVMLGGRAAELTVLKTVTTGSGNDIETATELARKMVCEWGMSNLGPLTFGKKREEIFLGREISQRRDYSEETAKEIDKEVRRIVEEQQERAIRIIKENLHSLHAIAKNLLEKEVLSGNDIDKILNKTKQVKAKTKRKSYNNNKKSE